FMLLEFMRELGVLELLPFLFAKSLGCHAAENRAKGTANRRADHRRRNAGDALENWRRPLHEPPDSAGYPAEKLVAFKLVGQLVLFPFALVLFELSKFLSEFPFELQLHFAFVGHGFLPLGQRNIAHTGSSNSRVAPVAHCRRTPMG